MLKGKGDTEEIPLRLRARQTAGDDLLSGQAEEGMRIIEREMIRLEPPSKEDLESTYDRLRVIHGEAYGWQPPDIQGIERLNEHPDAPVRARLDQ